MNPGLPGAISTVVVVTVLNSNNYIFSSLFLDFNLSSSLKSLCE